MESKDNYNDFLLFKIIKICLFKYLASLIYQLPIIILIYHFILILILKISNSINYLYYLPIKSIIWLIFSIVYFFII